VLVVVTMVGSSAYIVRLRSGRLLPTLTQVTRGPEIRNRLHTLRAAAAMARDHPLFGVGLENYHLLYPRYRPVDAERLTPDSVPTMVHDVYLQAAVTTGVVGLALYLIFLGAVMAALVRAYRRQSERPARLLIAACIASACGFLVADLTGWPEVSTAAIFFFVLGLGLSAAPANGAQRPPSAAVRALVDGAAVAWLVAILLLTIAAVQLVRADHALWRARSVAAVDWPAAQALVDHGLKMAGSRAAYRDAAASLFAERFGVTGDRVLYDRAALLFETAHAGAPFSEWVMIHRIDLETASLQKQKGGTPARAANEMAAALLAVDLHNGTVYESVARMRLAEGALTPALDMIGRAELLRPQQADYWRLEGDIRRAMGDRLAALAAYRHARAGMVAGSAEWLGVDRRLIVTLLEAGDYAEAIDETNQALALAPGDALLQRLLNAAKEAKRTRATES
jgi:phosphate/sulfate permease